MTWVDNDGSIGFSLQPSALTGWCYGGLDVLVVGRSDRCGCERCVVRHDRAAHAANATSVPDVTLCHSSFCWPIVIVSYLLMDNVQSPRGCAVRTAVVDFWSWYLSNYATTAPMLSHWGLAPTPTAHHGRGAARRTAAVLCAV